MTAAATTKACTKCGRELPVGAFARVRADRDWLRAKCRECEASRLRALRAQRRAAA